MNHCVPEFEMDDDYSIPSMSRPKKSNMAGDEIMELLWQNGQVVMQSQRSVKKPSGLGYGDELIAAADRREVQQPRDQQQQQSLFMQEEEMASWLLNDTPYDFCSDLLYSSASPCANTAAAAAATTPAATVTAPTTATATTASPSVLRPHAPEQHRQLLPSPRPPIHPVPPSRKMENFGHLSRLSRFRVDESGPSHSNRAVNDSTVVDSSDTPAAGRPHSRVSEAVHCEAARGPARGGALASLATSPEVRGGGGGLGEEAAYEATVTSSPGGSSASAEPPSQKPPPPAPPPLDRKRKAASEADDADCQSEDVDVEFADGKKHPRGSSSTKRSRAAEVHNLSERRRRDRINEKMKALQELIPHCNKADKASMLDEAIEYLKSLQLQVQMMSMGCSVVPMMFPGLPQYMPHMGMGIGMGMGMEMGMNRPMMPFPNVMAGSPLAAPGATAHLGARFPMPAFHMQHVDPSRGGVPSGHQPDPMLSSLMMQNSRQPRMPNFVDPYQQYMGLHHLQMQPQQNQNQAAQQGTSKPSTSKGAENLESPRSG